MTHNVTVNSEDFEEPWLSGDGHETNDKSLMLIYGVEGGILRSLLSTRSEYSDVMKRVEKIYH